MADYDHYRDADGCAYCGICDAQVASQYSDCTHCGTPGNSKPSMYENADVQRHLAALAENENGGSPMTWY